MGTTMLGFFGSKAYQQGCWEETDAGAIDKVWKLRGSAAAEGVAGGGKAKAGDRVEVEAPAGGSILVSAERKRPTLDELVAKITPENRHSETDWGKPRGKEVW